MNNQQDTIISTFSHLRKNLFNYKKAKSQKGFSLVELLVGVGLLGIIGAGLATMSVSAFKVNRTVDAGMSANGLHMEVMNVIASNELCTTALQGQAPGASLTINSLQAGVDYDKMVRVSDIRLEDYANYSANYRKGTLVVTYEKIGQEQGSVYGAKQKKLEYNLFVIESGGVITECVGGEIKTGEFYCIAVGGTWDSASALCKFDNVVHVDACNVIPGYKKVGNVCMKDCPSGYSLDSSQTACVKVCPSGSTATPSGICVVNPPVCPPSQIFNTVTQSCQSSSYTATLCSPPNLLDTATGSCVAPIVVAAAPVTCTAPQVYNSATNTCVLPVVVTPPVVTPPVTCTPPQVYDSATGTCVTPVAVTCTAPAVLDPATGTCVTPPAFCPSGTIKSTANGLCMKVPTYTCTNLNSTYIGANSNTNYMNTFGSQCSGAGGSMVDRGASMIPQYICNMPRITKSCVATVKLNACGNTKFCSDGSAVSTSQANVPTSGINVIGSPFEMFERNCSQTKKGSFTYQNYSGHTAVMCKYCPGTLDVVDMCNY